MQKRTNPSLELEGLYLAALENLSSSPGPVHMVPTSHPMIKGPLIPR